MHQWAFKKNSIPPNILFIWNNCEHKNKCYVIFPLQAIRRRLIENHIIFPRNYIYTLYCKTKKNIHWNIKFKFISFLGTRIGQASECFVYWKDPMTNDTWGLNFTSPIDAKQFKECCVSYYNIRVISLKIYGPLEKISCFTSRRQFGQNFDADYASICNPSLYLKSTYWAKLCTIYI